MSTASDMMKKVRETCPLVHHITNYVTVNDCANMCICAGGSPVMTDAEKDVPDMVKLASTVVLNIGTLNDHTIDSMLLAGRTANSLGIPVIVWVTNPIDDAPYLMNSWTAKDGALINWKHPSHTVVLTGYDLSGKTVTLSDPLQGTVKVSAEIFETRYAQMGSQAVAIFAG